MPVKKQAWAEGAPAWVDLMAADFDAAKAFYSRLFGWQFDASGEEFGNYATARLDGHAVAGIGPAQGLDAPPPAWTTYLATDDVEASSAKIAEAGGAVLMPVMDIGGFGSMAVVADPTGAVFGLWQAGEHTGVELYNEPGSLVWNEGMVGDYQAGKDFYAKAFGYSYTEIGDENMQYATADLDGETVTGIGTAANLGEGVPPHWRTYFAVADIDASCAKVTELGGAIVAEPFDTPFGKMAAATGPDGEAFLLNQAPEEAPELRAE